MQECKNGFKMHKELFSMTQLVNYQYLTNSCHWREERHFIFDQSKKNLAWKARVSRELERELEREREITERRDYEVEANRSDYLPDLKWFVKGTNKTKQSKQRKIKKSFFMKREKKFAFFRENTFFWIFFRKLAENNDHGADPIKTFQYKIWCYAGNDQSDQLKLVTWLIWLVNSSVESNSELEFWL